MQAALRAGVERVVYTSSVAALKPGKGEAVDETARQYGGKRDRRL